METSQIDQGILSAEKLKIIELMGRYDQLYQYETVGQLEFELEMRIKIIQAANLLNKSGAQFASFSTSKCNEEYWQRTANGGFALKTNVLPQTAIGDIFISGHKYAFECATAIVVIFYKAVLDSIDTKQFNRLFSDLYLYDWHHDQDLDLHIHEGTDFLPGDCVYFKNPEFNLSTPWWQGENAVMVDKDLYYGHGIGVRTSQFIILFLNTKRKRNAVKPAFLMNQITRLNLEKLIPFQVTVRDNTSLVRQFCHSANLVISEIGTKTYLL